MEEVLYTKGGIRALVIRSCKRKTIAIAINRSFEVAIRVPYRLSTTRAQDLLNSKENWIIKKIAEFEKATFQKQYPDYANDKAFYFLGNPYELQVIEAKQNSIELTNDKILLSINAKTTPEKILKSWFLTQSKRIFLERLLHCFSRFTTVFNSNMPTLTVRSMKSLGSLRDKKIMTLNTNLIHLRTQLIDYVIMHELCHLKHSKHDKKFYALQEKMVPSWKSLKREILYGIHTAIQG